ncbi:hypothetical protein [Caulobacter phage Cr30]|uniref:hypothetical protein n=1 Tax=Caulobacter phage Cr30 TaxID=1357714 RepID=UPI0004A9B7B1|nr:hypothetical protein OZ74_gp117 [Caulobacter phage Cr30]AGS81002.1 hypothetical protein [Caulobacter phage Cr30]
MQENLTTIGQYRVFPKKIKQYLEDCLRNLNEVEVELRNELVKKNKELAGLLEDVAKARAQRVEFETAMEKFR